MLIKIAGLSDGVHSICFDEPVEELGLNEPFFGNYYVDATLNKSHNQLVLDAEITLNAKFECDRCASDYSTKLKTKYQMVYFFRKESSEDNSLNVKYLPAETDKINLQEELHDYSVLAIPMKKLCNEDCKGLCPTCGKDLNEGECGCLGTYTDARWLPLQELKNKLNNN